MLIRPNELAKQIIEFRWSNTEKELGLMTCFIFWLHWWQNLAFYMWLCIIIECLLVVHCREWKFDIMRPAANSGLAHSFLLSLITRDSFIWRHINFAFLFIIWFFNTYLLSVVVCINEYEHSYLILFRSGQNICIRTENSCPQ